MTTGASTAGPNTATRPDSENTSSEIIPIRPGLEITRRPGRPNKENPLRVEPTDFEIVVQVLHHGEVIAEKRQGMKGFTVSSYTTAERLAHDAVRIARAREH